jgi:hypothetical protein
MAKARLGGEGLGSPSGRLRFGQIPSSRKENFVYQARKQIIDATNNREPKPINHVQL